MHIPFCRRRCDYCAFATWEDRHHLWERYVAACRKQAAAVARWRRGPATSVYFGGGTPSLLPAELLVAVLEDLRVMPGLAHGAEVTVECNPETVTLGLLATYRSGGVTRLSFGAQSMVPHVLKFLGRQHEPDTVRRAAGFAGEGGFAGAYSVDLIFGAHGESVRDWQASLAGILALDPPPPHVSAYALTVEPGTPLAQRMRLDPGGMGGWMPDDDQQAEKYLLADSVLAEAGLEWYEISNWAKPGAECAHNLLYWSQGEYIGIGCAANLKLGT